MRRSKFACLLGVTCVFLLAGCSADDGRPITGPTGPGSGTGTGGGKGSGAGTGESRQEQPTDDATEQSTSPTDPAPATATKKANAQGPCASNSECESGVCFVGGTQSYCSAKCTAADAATTCAAPFTGSCNKQGFCKRD